MKKKILLSITIILLSSLFLNIGCNKDYKLTDPTGTKIFEIDPMGEKTGPILKDSKPIGVIIRGGKDYLSMWGWQYVGGDNENFITPIPGIKANVSIINMGKIQGLSYITKIPQTGFSEPYNSQIEIKCEKNFGYIVKFDDGSTNPIYVRIFAEEDQSGGIGDLKYQYPFIP